MHTQTLQHLGLSKNESIIYETLLAEGESSVGNIATKSKVHRRNVYDTLKRLLEKGLVFEIVQRNENRYKAVDPSKLMELIQEKESMLSKIMPQLQDMYTSKPQTEEVYVYRGPEGWKNYMRDMIRIGEPVYLIGAKGAWLDERVQHFFPHFQRAFEKMDLPFYHLFDHDIQTECPQIMQHVGKHYKFLPKGYSTPAAIDIFGDHVNIISNMVMGGFKDEFSVTVIVNRQIADAFRIWFQFMWDFCPGET
jgi:predicted DNA-binding transcriptional regulator